MQLTWLKGNFEPCCAAPSQVACKLRYEIISWYTNNASLQLNLHLDGIAGRCELWCRRETNFTPWVDVVVVNAFLERLKGVRCNWIMKYFSCPLRTAHAAQKQHFIWRWISADGFSPIDGRAKNSRFNHFRHSAAYLTQFPSRRQFSTVRRCFVHN